MITARFGATTTYTNRIWCCRWRGESGNNIRKSYLVRRSYSGNQKNNHHAHHNGRIPPYMWISSFGAVLAVGCFYYSYLDEVPISKRKRWLATSTEWESAMGDRQYKELIREYRNDILPSDHRASITVRRVGSRIAKAADEFRKQHGMVSGEKKGPPSYTYTVVRSDTANAFVLPNDHIFVMTGLFRYVRNEDDLAAVLGHEMAHNIARHVGERVSGSVIIGMLARFTLLWDPSGTLFSVFVPATELLRNLPHSRTHETEADQIGIYLAAEACYDPRAAKSVFQTMKDQDGASSSPEFLSTHPSHDTRMSDLDVWMPQAMQKYNEDFGNRCHRLRKEMEMARKVAAVQAAAREKRRVGT